MKTPLLSYGIVVLVLITPANAQRPDLNKMLDSVDRPSAWAKTPVSEVNPSGQFAGQFASQEFMHHQNPSYSSVNPIIHPMANPAVINQLQQDRREVAPLFRQEMLRTFLNGSTSQPSSNASQSGGNKSFNGSTAYSDWQRAENEAIKARNYASKARYDQNQWNRKDDANSANYAADAARQASDRVYYASLNGDPVAQQYASKARAAADRARADANRARYNADTIR